MPSPSLYKLSGTTGKHSRGVSRLNHPGDFYHRLWLNCLMPGPELPLLMQKPVSVVWPAPVYILHSSAQVVSQFLDSQLFCWLPGNCFCLASRINSTLQRETTQRFQYTDCPAIWLVSATCVKFSPPQMTGRKIDPETTPGRDVQRLPGQHWQ